MPDGNLSTRHLRPCRSAESHRTQAGRADRTKRIKQIRCYVPGRRRQPYRFNILRALPFPQAMPAKAEKDMLPVRYGHGSRSIPHSLRISGIRNTCWFYPSPYTDSEDNRLYVSTMSTADAAAASMSDTGIEYNTPSSPKKTGSSSASPTPNTISRAIDSSVEAAALPIACRKMNAALFTHASGSYTEKNAEGLDRILRIVNALICRAENTDERFGKQSRRSPAKSSRQPLPPTAGG